MKKHLLFFSISVVTLISCNKDKFYSKRLMKGDKWTVNRVVINDTLSTISGVWEITQDVNIFDSVPQAIWKNNADDALFQWQFHEKAKKFYINYQLLCAECETNTLDTLDNFTYALSGQYNVVNRTRKIMEFESTTTRGFTGKKVQIRLTKN